jgi:hypothetical protein
VVTWVIPIWKRGTTPRLPYLVLCRQLQRTCTLQRSTAEKDVVQASLKKFAVHRFCMANLAVR